MHADQHIADLARCKLLSGQFHDDHSVSIQDPQQLCVMDLSTGAVREGSAVLSAPETPQDFAAQLSLDGSALLLQKDKGAFLLVQLPSLKVCRLAERWSRHIFWIQDPEWCRRYGNDLKCIEHVLHDATCLILC